MHCKTKEIFRYSPSPRNLAENSGEFLARLFEEHGDLPIIFQCFQFFTLENSLPHTKNLMEHGFFIK